MDDNGATPGADETPDPLADFVTREEYDDPWSGVAAHAEGTQERHPEGSHRRGMLAGLAGVAILLAVLVVVAPGGSRPKLPPQMVRDITPPSASASATAPASGSTATPGAASRMPSTAASAFIKSTKNGQPGTPAGSTSAAGAGFGQAGTLTASRSNGGTTSTGAAPVAVPPGTSGQTPAPTTTSRPPARTTTTSPPPPKTTTTSAPPPKTTTTSAPPPPTTTTTTTICVLIVCL